MEEERKDIRINYKKEVISERELSDFAIRIRNLNDEKIDELWFRCGYIIVDHRKDFKALRQSDIDRIRRNIQSAREVLWNLIIETPIDIFKKKLAEVEAL